MYADLCVILAFACVVSGSSDGDGVRFRGGTRTSWTGIDAPEVSFCTNGRNPLKERASA